eukprot:scaffold65614_cov18-Tisochrysis_lutea.AAC.1
MGASLKRFVQNKSFTESIDCFQTAEQSQWRAYRSGHYPILQRSSKSKLLLLGNINALTFVNTCTGLRIWNSNLQQHHDHDACLQSHMCARRLPLAAIAT